MSKLGVSAAVGCQPARPMTRSVLDRLSTPGVVRANMQYKVFTYFCSRDIQATRQASKMILIRLLVPDDARCCQLRSPYLLNGTGLSKYT
jgi:hypothetical protein